MDPELLEKCNCNDRNSLEAATISDLAELSSALDQAVQRLRDGASYVLDIHTVPGQAH